MDNIIDLNESNFLELIEKNRDLIIINFSADWCGSCKIMISILEEISKEENTKVFNVNVDHNSNLTSEFEIKNIPVTLFFKSGQKLFQMNGLKSKEELKEKLYELR